jgi:hypothetical protein
MNELYFFKKTIMLPSSVWKGEDREDNRYIEFDVGYCSWFSLLHHWIGQQVPTKESFSIDQNLIEQYTKNGNENL